MSIASKMVNVDPSDLGSTAGVVNEGTIEKQGDSCDTSVASSKIVQVDASSEREGVSLQRQAPIIISLPSLMVNVY